MSLRKKMAHGALWSLLEKIGQNGIAFLVFIIIARLIGPEEFGLVNICYVYIALTNVVVVGLVDGIVSLKLRDNKNLSTLFWTVTGFGIGLALLGVAVAHPFAVLMNQPRLENLLYWISISPILLATSSVPTFLIMAKMNFRVYAMRTLISIAIGGIVGVIMAVKGYGAYALVAQQIVQFAVINIVVWPGCKWLPKLIYDRSVLQKILAPGIKMSGSSFVNVLDQQAPRLIIGAFLGPVYVGYFAFVARFRQALYDVLMHPLAVVIYPAFSEIKNNTDEQKAILRQILVITSLLVFPAIAGGIVTSPIFVPLFFGEVWSPAIPVLQLLLITGGTVPFIVILRDILRAHNKTGIYLRAQTIIVFLTICATCLLTPYGLIPLSGGLVILSMISVPVFILCVAQATEMVLWRTFTCLWAPLVSSIIMALCVNAFINSSLLPQNGWAALGTAMIMGIVIYTAACFVIQPKEIKNLYVLAKRLRAKQ